MWRGLRSWLITCKPALTRRSSGNETAHLDTEISKHLTSFNRPRAKWRVEDASHFYSGLMNFRRDIRRCVNLLMVACDIPWTVVILAGRTANLHTLPIGE